MANVLSESKRQQVVALGRLNWSLRQIQEAVKVRRETASAYLKAAGVPIRTARGRRPPPKPASQASTESGADSNPARQAITDPEAPPPPPPAAKPSECEPYREIVEEALGKRRNGVSIYQELVDKHGFAASYSSVRRFVRRLRGRVDAKTFAVIHTDPGEEAQVDYGTGPLVRHPETGKYRRTRLFVLTLGCSRKSVRLLVWKSSARMWAELHEIAFRRLGGCPRVLVLDNLKEGVLTPDIYDPELNPLYRDVLAHYGAVALPCRVRHPDRKGKVERSVDHAQETPLQGQKFDRIKGGQAHLDHWEERWADTRIHGTTKRQVAAMFAEEKPFLLPLPVEPFRYYQYGERVVHLDGCVEVEAAYYGAPPGWIGRAVRVQWNELFVRLLDPKTGQLLREHVRQKRGWYRIKPEDHPKRTPLRTSQLLWRAGRAGAHIGALCEAI